MHVLTKLSPSKNALSLPQGQGSDTSDTSAPTVHTSEEDGPVWRDPLEHSSFITTSPTTTMSEEDLYPTSLSMALQSPESQTDRRSFASKLEASLLASNLTAATTTLNSTSSSSSSQDLSSTIGNDNVTTTTTSTADSNSKDSKGDIHSEETKATAATHSPSSSEPAEEDSSSRTSIDKSMYHAHSHSHSHSHTYSRTHSNTHSRDSSVQSPPSIVKETLDAGITVSPTGMLQVKQYELRRIIGQGAFGIVNLGVDINTGIKYVRLFVSLFVLFISFFIKLEMATRS